MRKNVSLCGLVGLAMVVAALVGCGRDPAKFSVKELPGEPRTTPDPAAKAFLLESEPAGARQVKEVVTDTTHEGEVVVLGRIGGEAKPFFDGQTAFLITDRSLRACSEIEGDTCPVPWDFCCVPPNDLAAGTLTVKIVDDSGEPLSHAARSWMGLRELDTVVVKGRLVRSEEGSVTVLATGLYRKP